MGKLILFLIQIFIVLWLISLLIGWLADKGRDSKTLRDLRSIRKQFSDTDDENYEK